MIFWNFFMATLGLVVGVTVAIAAVIGFLVLSHVGKQMYDDKRRTTWRNEPPVHRS